LGVAIRACRSISGLHISCAGEANKNAIHLRTTLKASPPRRSQVQIGVLESLFDLGQTCRQIAQLRIKGKDGIARPISRATIERRSAVYRARIRQEATRNAPAVGAEAEPGDAGPALGAEAAPADADADAVRNAPAVGQEPEPADRALRRAVREGAALRRAGPYKRGPYRSIFQGADRRSLATGSRGRPRACTPEEDQANGPNAVNRAERRGTEQSQQTNKRQTLPPLQPKQNAGSHRHVPRTAQGGQWGLRSPRKTAPSQQRHA